MALADSQSRILGMPNLPYVVLPHPIGGTAFEAVFAKVDKALDEIILKLTVALAPLPVESKPVALPTEWIDIDVADEWFGVQDTFVERGWSDGLPVIPPTPERVAAFVAASGLSGEQLVAVIAPKMGGATVEKIAANAVMAGCRREHMPLLIAAVRALADPKLNLYGLQTTTHCCAPLMIVSGPLAETLRVHSGSGLFGPGPWANGVLGRAVRHILLNIGGGKPVEIDKATMGQPGKFSFCIAENEAASPWPGMRADLGIDRNVSTVTMVGGEAPHNINDHESATGGGLLMMITGTLAQTGQNNVYYAGEPLLLLCPEHAATIANDGYSKDDVKRVIYDEARVPLNRFSRENIERRMFRKFPIRFRNMPTASVTVAQRWQDVMVIVAGGPGKHSMYVPTFGATLAATQPILKPDGTPLTPADVSSLRNP